MHAIKNRENTRHSLMHVLRFFTIITFSKNNNIAYMKKISRFSLPKRSVILLKCSAKTEIQCQKKKYLASAMQNKRHFDLSFEFCMLKTSIELLCIIRVSEQTIYFACVSCMDVNMNLLLCNLSFFLVSFSKTRSCMLSPNCTRNSCTNTGMHITLNLRRK